MADKEKQRPALRVNPKRIIAWPVTVRVSVNGGEIEEQEFTVLYTRMMRSERMELKRIQQSPAELTDEEKKLTGAALEEARLNAEQRKNEKIKGMIKRHIRGWNGVVDWDKSEPIPFSEELLEAFLDDECIGAALEIGLIQVSSGVAASKNSETGAAS